MTLKKKGEGAGNEGHYRTAAECLTNRKMPKLNQTLIGPLIVVVKGNYNEGCSQRSNAQKYYYAHTKSQTLLRANLQTGESKTLSFLLIVLA